MEDSSRITHATPMHGPINNQLFDLWELALVDIFFKKYLSCTSAIVTLEALCAVCSLTILDPIHLVAGRTSERGQGHKRLSSR